LFRVLHLANKFGVVFVNYIRTLPVKSVLSRVRVSVQKIEMLSIRKIFIWV